MKRRSFIGWVCMTGAALLAWRPRWTWAARPDEAFRAQALADTLAALGADQAQESDAVTFEVPTVSGNSAQVPIVVETRLPHVEAISVVVAGNPQPLAATFAFSPAALPYLAVRIKMAKTSDVIALVKADGRLYSTRKNVTITVSGC
jgi:sulfur-oxidizing protein SoxY